MIEFWKVWLSIFYLNIVWFDIVLVYSIFKLIYSYLWNISVIKYVYSIF